MKKNLIILCLVTISSLAYSQVGINTPNPQGILHVDAAKDNPATGAPTVVQQLNDFTVTSSGAVGIGTTTPSEKLEVNGGARIANLPNASLSDRAVYADATGVLKVSTSSTANRVIWGVVRPNPDNTVTILNSGSGGWTVARNGIGTVMITVATPFSTPPAANAIQYLNTPFNTVTNTTFQKASPQDNAGVDNVSLNQIQVWACDSNFNRADRVISFSVTGF